MFIGKWNKSVLITYVGLIFSVIGIYICFTSGNILHALSCLMISGVCDMFDGKVARMCKRTKEEKEFGIQLDSLVDTGCFVMFPIIILLTIGLKKWYHIIVLSLFGICGIARLAYFNITAETNDQPVKYYTGLPVTAIAMVLPLFYLLKYCLPYNIFLIVLTIIIFINAILNISKIKVKKPTGIAYPIFASLALIMLILFLGVL